MKGYIQNIRGIKAELLVQEKLWRYGYGVERMPSIQKTDPRGQPYDLLVNKKYGVEVKSAMLRNRTWTFYGKHLLGADRGLIDVFAFVFFYPDDTYKVSYMKVGAFLKRNMKKTYYVDLRPNDKDLIKSPIMVFGKRRIAKRNSMRRWRAKKL